MSKAHYITTAFFIIFARLGAQNSYLSDNNHQSEPTYKNSSENMQLANSANVGVDYSTGTAFTNIALYSVTTGGISLPVSLNYASGGIKVDDESSWTGLGWVLSTGTIITRQIKGRADEVFYININTSNAAYQAWKNDVADPYHTLQPCNLQNCTFGCANCYGTYETFFKKAAGYISPCGSNTGPVWDIESDIYTLNILGKKIQFIFNNNGNVVMLNNDNHYQIIFNNRNFTVVDESGTKYFFSSTDAEKVKPDLSGTSYYYSNTPLTYYNRLWDTYGSAYNMTGCSSQSAFGGSSTPPIIKWNLTRVESADAKYAIDMSYEAFKNYTFDQSFVYNVNKTTLQPYVYQYNDAVLPSDPANTDHGVFLTESFNTYYSKRIKKISWSKGSVNFEYNTARQDVFTMPNTQTDNKSLDYIKIYDERNILLKQYHFNYGYFVSNVITNENTGLTFRNKRLKLMSLNEAGSDLKTCKPPYIFEYEATNLPVKWSFEKDFWGYYKANGATHMQGTQYYYANYSNTDLTDYKLWAQCYIYPINMPGWGTPVTINGADRLPNLGTTKACLLKKIQLPTQGTYSFDYELHDFCVDNDLVNRNSGGVRVKSITNSDGVNLTKDIVKNFYYTYETVLLSGGAKRSSGEINFMPLFGRDGNDVFNVKRYNSFKIHSNNYAQSVTENTPTVYYREVKVEELGKGSTIYKYDNAGTFGHNQDYSVNGQFLIQKNKTEIIHYDGNNPMDRNDIQVKRSNYPYCPEPNTEWANGTLKEVQVRDINNNIVYKKVFNYLVPSFNKITFNSFSSFTASRPSINDFYLDKTFATSPYYYLSVWKVLDSETEYVYNKSFPNDISKAQSKVINYSYTGTNHKFLSSKSSIESNGITLKENYKYVADYNPTGQVFTMPDAPSMALLNMKKTNQLKTLVEHIIIETKQEDDFLIGGKLCSFKDLANYTTSNGSSNNTPVVRLAEEYNLEISNPLLLSSFNPSSVNAVSTNTASFSFDANYKRKTSNQLFDSKGNILQSKIENGPTTSILYGYNAEVPIAQIYGAYYKECAYTSFESDDVNAWSNNLNTNNIVNFNKHSGEYSYLLANSNSSNAISYNLIRDFPANTIQQTGKYIVSCWANTPSNHVANTTYLTICTNNGVNMGTFYPNINMAYQSLPITNTNGSWKYFSVIIDLNKIRTLASLPPPPYGPALALRTFINSSAPTNETILIDDLRIQPYESSMTSMTYKPNVGVTSQLDGRNELQLFEYDEFQRLKLVRDLNNNIIEKTLYNYKNNCQPCQ